MVQIPPEVLSESLLKAEQILGTECIFMFSISPLLLSVSLHTWLLVTWGLHQLDKKIVLSFTLKVETESFRPESLILLFSI